MTNIAIENDVEIVDFPIENGGSFHSYVAVYQRVHFLNQQSLGYAKSTSLPPKAGAKQAGLILKLCQHDLSDHLQWHRWNASNQQKWSCRKILDLSIVPLSKLHFFFPFCLHLLSLPVSKLHFAVPFFLQLSCLPLSELHVLYNPICFCTVSPFYQNVNIHQHKRNSTAQVQPISSNSSVVPAQHGYNHNSQPLPPLIRSKRHFCSDTLYVCVGR